MSPLIDDAAEQMLGNLEKHHSRKEDINLKEYVGFLIIIYNQIK